jgi:hypothetical protein
MKAIDNSGFLNVCHNCGGEGFGPGISYSLNTATKVLTITSTSVFPVTDTLKVINVSVSDRFGNQKKLRIIGPAITGTVDLSTFFNTSLGFNIQAVIVSNKRLIADLTAYEVGATTGAAAGVLGYADIETDEVVE